MNDTLCNDSSQYRHVALADIRRLLYVAVFVDRALTWRMSQTCLMWFCFLLCVVCRLVPVDTCAYVRDCHASVVFLSPHDTQSYTRTLCISCACFGRVAPQPEPHDTAKALLYTLKQIQVFKLMLCLRTQQLALSHQIYVRLRLDLCTLSDAV